MGRVQGPSAYGRQHSSFGPTSLSCALSNSVSDCEKGRLADQIYIYLSDISDIYIWRGIPISLFMPIMSTSIVVKTV